MNVLGLILPDELVLSIAMTTFSDLPAHVQFFLAVAGAPFTAWAIKRVVELAMDLYDYLRCGPEKRQEIRNSRRWFKQWRGQ